MMGDIEEDGDTYYRLETQLKLSSEDLSPAVLHGALCGTLSAGRFPGAEAWQREVLSLFDETDVGLVLEEMLVALYQTTQQQLESSDFNFVLLLPEDAPLQKRTELLGEWCGAFLESYGEKIGGWKLDKTAEEQLSGLTEVARIDAESDESDDHENSFLTVCEFVRVAVMTLFTERNLAVD